MELTETVESINRQLSDLFGIDTITGIPIWRVVWSEEQREKRRITHFGGIQLSYPEVRELPKYPYIKERYILERLTIIPPINADDLPVSELSYEPVFVFENPVTREYLPPRVDAAKFVIDVVYAALGKTSLAKYKEDMEQHTPEAKEERIKKLQEELFGNETDTGDALAYDEGIVVPQNYDKEN